MNGIIFCGNFIQQCMISVEFAVYCDFIFYNVNENSVLYLHQMSVIISLPERC